MTLPISLAPGKSHKWVTILTEIIYAKSVLHSDLMHIIAKTRVFANIGFYLIRPNNDEPHLFGILPDPILRNLRKWWRC